MDDVPLRIGDADRDRAIERLRTAMAEGRLTYEEFDERLGLALGAKFESDLEPLFVDLPPLDVPAPVTPVTNPGLNLGAGGYADRTPARRYGGPRHGFYGALWPMTMVLIVASGFRLWWLFLLPFVLGPLLAGNRGPRSRRHLPPGER